MALSNWGKTKAKSQWLFYTYKVTWSDEDGEFIGTCEEFPSLSFLADSLENTFSGILETVKNCLKDMVENNEEVPKAVNSKF